MFKGKIFNPKLKTIHFFCLAEKKKINKITEIMFFLLCLLTDNFKTF